MSRRGTFYAITTDEAEPLLGLVGRDGELANAVHDLYTMERQRGRFIAGVDKSWDAMHRILTDGTLADVGKGDHPLSWCVLGGKNLHAGSEYIICYLTPEQVKQVAEEIDDVDLNEFVSAYRSLPASGYSGAYGDEDLEYVWDHFTSVRNFYSKAAEAGRAVVFIADQ